MIDYSRVFAVSRPYHVRVWRRRPGVWRMHVRGLPAPFENIATATTHEHALGLAIAWADAFREVVRADRERVWDEGFDAGEIDANLPIDHDPCIQNPYIKKGHR